MRRSRLLILASVAGSLAAAPVAHGQATTVRVPNLFAKQISAISARGIPVRVPSVLVVGVRRAYRQGGLIRGGYALSIAGTPRCGSANACTVATLSAERDRQPYGTQRVRLRNGVVGRYTPMSCGASCADPTIEWRQDGYTSSISAALGRTSYHRYRLMVAANQAIVAGPR